MILYHLTPEQNLESIRRHGIVPNIGKNSQYCNEEEKMVYLCNENSLPYWSKLLGIDVAIAIDRDDLDESKLTKFYYSDYSEYLYNDTINYSSILYVQYTIPKLSINEEKELCLGYIDNISKICESYARYYLNPYNESIEDLNKLKKCIEPMIKSALVVLSRLNFKLLTDQEIQSHIINYGEMGEFTLCDKCDFKNDNCSLYEKLVRYPDDDQTALRNSLYSFIENAFNSNCLNINTGGYIL